MPQDLDNYAREGRLQPRDAVVALILSDDGRYLMQLRDQKQGIFFPGHWGLFGGAIDDGEDEETALRRELREELAIDVGSLSYFTRMTFDFGPHGFGIVSRSYFEVWIPNALRASIRLGEGAAIKSFEGEALLKNERVTPYDAFAVWMHVTRKS